MVIMKALDILVDKDISELLQIRWLTYFGHVSGISAERLQPISLYVCTDRSQTSGSSRK